MRLLTIALFAFSATFFVANPAALAANSDPWVVYEGSKGPGWGKHIVLLAGDEEYRSEECLPQLGKILSRHHGFKCTVLFSIDDKGEIDPKNQKNTPGTEALDSADLMIILARFRAPTDEQMKHIDSFLKAGKPVLGLRTATHSFSGLKGTYEMYNYNYKGSQPAWSQGFGRLVLGETWISHHGNHKSESTRGIFAPEGKESPLLTGIKDGEIWGATDVYGVRLPLPGDSKPIVLGQVSKRALEATKEQIAKDKNYMLSPKDTPLEGKKNEPMMPIVWTKSYQLPEGKPGRSITTTMGSATDIENEAFRRLLVNSVYDLLGIKTPEKVEVGIVGEYTPSAFGFGGNKVGVKPADLNMK